MEKDLEANKKVTCYSDGGLIEHYVVGVNSALVYAADVSELREVNFWGIPNNL